MRAAAPALRPGAVFVAAGLLLLLNIIVIPTLTWDIWIDEYYTLETLGAPPLFEPRSISAVVSYLAEKDPVHPPGYFVLLSLWGRLAGWNAPVLRSFSLFAGLLALALLFRLAQRHLSPSHAMPALVFTGFNVAFIHMLRDLRGYAMLQFTVVLMLYTWAEVIRDRRIRVRSLAPFICSAALNAWTNYFGIIAALALALCNLLWGLRHRRFLPVTGAFAVAGLLFLPWAGVVANALLKEQGGTLSRGYNTFHSLEYVRQVLEHFSNGNEALMLLMAAQALVSLRAALPWLWTFFGILLLLAFNQFMPLLRIRYAFFLWPGLGMLVALGADRLRKVCLPALILPFAWIIALLWQTAPHTQGPFRDLVSYRQRPPFQSVARRLKDYTLPGDVLVWHREESKTLHEGKVFPGMLQYAAWQLPVSDYRVTDSPPEDTDEQYLLSRNKEFSGISRVWLTWQKADRHRRIAMLTGEILPRQGLRRCNVLNDAQEPVRIELWARAPEAGPGAVWRFADDAGRQISLQPGTPSPAPQGAGQHYTLFWDSGLPHGHSAGLYRLDADGRLLTQLDVGLERGRGCHSGVLAGPIAPGDSLWLGVYDWRNGARLAPLDEPGENNLVRIG